MWYMTSLIFAIAIISLLIFIKLKPRYIFIISILLYLVGCFYPLNIEMLLPVKDVSLPLWNILKFTYNIIEVRTLGSFIFIYLGIYLAFNKKSLK